MTTPDQPRVFDLVIAEHEDGTVTTVRARERLQVTGSGDAQQARVVLELGQNSIDKALQRVSQADIDAAVTAERERSQAGLQSVLDAAATAWEHRDRTQ